MRSVFEIVIVTSSMIGTMSAAHLATILVRSRIVGALDMTKIVTGCFATSLLAFLWRTPTSLFQIWMTVQAPLAIAIAAAFLLAKRRDRAVEESLDDLLSRLMMRMKEGRSLAVALELVASEVRSSLRPRWVEIARSVSFSPQKSSREVQLKSLRLIEIAREFQRIDLLSRSQLTELERWRQRIRTERTFRRRSVQAMAQVRAQSLILATIFTLLSLFSVGAFGWKATCGPFQIALPLFCVGLFFIWRGGRRIKWSV